MKLSLSHYRHESIPDTKFEADSSSSFEDMTSQNFPRNKGTSHQLRLFTPGKRAKLLKNEFLCPESFFRPKIDPSCQFQQFSNGGNFFIFKIFGTSR